ncbi:ATP-binding protein [Candidatus Uhrbacteria bacterium]|nr:ATP-binding protein [Candidatus Uhrbacteria bacterium]
MYYKREIERIVENYLSKNAPGKNALIIYGARQVGKTTLIKEVLRKHPEGSQYYNCDYADVQEQFAYTNAGRFGSLVRGLKLLVLDEAQRIENIGLVLKILVDEFPHLQIIATGSSSFELSNKINEPLTGRKVEIMLFPLSIGELFAGKDAIERQRMIPELLRFGSYPLAVNQSTEESEAYLKELTNSYLFKDIFTFQDLRKPEILGRLLQLLAFQIGHEVSYHELASQLHVDQTVVQRYLDLLEKAFVVFRLPALSRNLRKEVSKTRKIYFYDLGVRNMIIKNFNDLSLRNDTGDLWENFCILERLKHLEYAGSAVNTFFWRTYDQKEIDYIEERGGTLNAYECKWGDGKKVKEPKEFLSTYEGSSFEVVTPRTLEAFVFH